MADSPAALKGLPLAIASVALAIGTFMQVLDSTIANVSIPTIAGDLGVSTSQGTWIITTFAVANGVSVPLTGWLMQRFGVVRTFVASVLLFTLMSLLCGLAWNLPSLLLFRILQGAVSGPMIPGSQALLIMIFPTTQRATALAIWSMTTLVAPICGPVLGGYISDNYSWPWIFLINVPVGIGCAYVCWGSLRTRETPTAKLPIDTIGLSLLVLWVGSLQIMLDTGKDADWFSSPLIVVEALIAAVGFVAWIIWECFETHPIVDLSFFKSRNFVFGAIAFCFGYAVFFGNSLLLTLWLQTQMGYIATWAGLVAAPSGVVAVILTPVVARLNVDARISATFALAAFTLSFYLRSLYAPDSDFIALIIPMLVMGAGMSAFFIAMITICLTGIPGDQVPKASGLINFARITAGAFAASLTTTVWERSAAQHQTRLAETSGHVGDSVWTQAVATLQSHGASLQQAGAALYQQIAHQAFFLASIDLFRISAWATLVLIPIVWLTRRSTPSGSVAAAD